MPSIDKVLEGAGFVFALGVVGLIAIVMIIGLIFWDDDSE